MPGLAGLTDQQKCSLFDLSQQLRNQYAEIRFHTVADGQRDLREIALIFVPETKGAICEKPGKGAEAWIRQGNQNIPLDAARRDRLRRDKLITSFEDEYCCPFDISELDVDVVQAFRLARHEEESGQQKPEDFLYNCGALLKTREGLAFTKAGMLFFGMNPQRVLPASYIRLLKFELLLSEAKTTSLPTADRSFRGSVVRQIRELRAFFRGSSFFKVYQRRADAGGFIDDPEYPHIAVDEAIVNAVAHRDYAITYPTECRYYRDAFVVVNGGRLQQRDHDVPGKFSLENTQLTSTPRNPKLMDWLRMMRDSNGASFVQALSEGTRRMQVAMSQAALPAPSYEITEAQTILTLFSEAPRREAQLRTNVEVVTTEFANLYPVTLVPDSAREPDPEWEPRRKEISSALQGALEANGWFIDRASYGRIVAHRRGSEFNVPEDVRRIIRLFPAYSMQLKGYFGQPYLCLDYGVEVKNALYVNTLLRDFTSNELTDLRVIASWKGGWHSGKLRSADNETSQVLLLDFQTEVSIPSNKVLPSLPLKLIDRLLGKYAGRFDLHKEVKRLSLSSEPKAARTRAQKTDAMAVQLSESIFPLKLNECQVLLLPTPTPLDRHDGTDGRFPVYGLPEPEVEFSHHHATSDIRNGITRYGAFEQEAKTIELVPVCVGSMQANMASLIERLQTGKYQYKGSERTFRARLTYNSVITAASAEDIHGQCERLLRERPEWAGAVDLNRLFLVQTPEAGYTLDDEQSPYFRTKRLHLEAGVPCQMIDSPTLVNPDWKDLNLALNITAKCGVTPWVLPDAIPDADVFIGLSYTQSRRAHGARYMGYANVFDQFGQWQFYSGSSSTFAYEQRAKRFGELISTTLQRIGLSPTPMIPVPRQTEACRGVIMLSAGAISFTFQLLATTRTARVLALLRCLKSTCGRTALKVNPRLFLICGR